MRVITKKRIQISICTLIILVIGVLIGIAISKPYFQHGKNIDITLARLNQTYDYLLLIDNSGSDTHLKLINKLVFDLGYYLDTLLIMRQFATELMEVRICEQTKLIVNDKKRFMRISLQTDKPVVYGKHLNTFLDALEGCSEK
jgi:hypothetical protein